MKNTFSLILISTVLFLSSCHKFLTNEPKDFLNPEGYFETEDQLKYALNGVYATLTSSGLYASYMMGRMGLDGDQGYNYVTGDSYTVSDYTITASDGKISAYWEAAYSGINRANLLLENIDKAQVTEVTKNRIKGEALFLRAYFHFMLVDRFGNVPLILHTVSSSSPESLQIAQSPAKVVYEKILEDMEAASLLVDDAQTVGMGGRISKSAIWGIMSRVCLYMAGNPVNDVARYADAKKWAEKVITTGTHSLNPSFSQVFINHCQDLYDIKESIWEVEFWGNGTGNFTTAAGYVGRNNGIGNTQDPNIGYSNGCVRATRPFYQLFQASDVRRDWTIAPFRYSGNPGVSSNWTSTQIYTRYCGKWRRIYELVTPRNTVRTPTNFPILRYSDVLLMYAEADNAVNASPSSAAYNAINQVRRRAFNLPVTTPNASVDLQGLSKTAFSDELKDERSRELGYECLRKSDLIRWGLFAANMKFVYNDVNGDVTDTGLSATRTFNNASARDVLWPIPSYEMGVNKKLVQNPGF